MKTALLLFLRILGLVVGWADLGMEQTAGVEMRNEWRRVRSHDSWNYLHARGRMRANGTDVL